MRGRDFLDLAREVVRGGKDQHWRGAVIHAYYGAFLECRGALTRWRIMVPRQQSVHSSVRIKFRRAGDADLQRIGDILDLRCHLRNFASYDLRPLRDFANDTAALDTIQDAASALALLDAIDTDPARRAAAIASLPP